MRKLVTIQKIEEIKSIEGADKICAYKILGWWVVDAKEKYKIGDYVIFCEIDSWIPHDLAPFLSKGKEPKEYNGIKGEKLRTIRLKGQISQGLILPTILFSCKFELSCPSSLELLYNTKEDLSGMLNIQKWESPIPSNMGGKIKGNFPSFICKTDQERVQNLWKEYKEKYNDIEFEVSLKLDGTSFTSYYNDGKFGVCSRNLELIEDKNNIYWKIAKNLELEEKLKKLNRNLAIQGELIGEGIQSNKEKTQGNDLYIFDIYDIDKQCYLTHNNRLDVLSKLDLQDSGIKFIEKCFYKLSEFNNIEDILKFADGKSLNNDIREGVVFKSKGYIDGQIVSFKVISNRFLENEK